MNPDFRVMTSGGFTAAYRELIPQLQQLTGLEIVTVTTSIGTGETSIPNRLKRGEIADLVICAETVFQSFLADQLVRAEHHAPLARSIIGFAVRAGAPKPDIATPEKLRDTLLHAKSIGYSASESGKYVTTQLYQRLGIADEAQASRLHIFEAAAVIPHRKIGDVVVQRIGGEIPSPNVLVDGAVDVVAQNSSGIRNFAVLTFT